MRIFQLCASSLDTPYFRGLACGLAQHGLRVHWASLAERRPPPWIAELGARYHYMEAPRRRDYPGVTARLAWLLRRERIELVQTHLYDAGLIGIAAARLARIPFSILTRHHLDDAALGGTSLHVALDKLMARSADCVVVPSEAVKRHMVECEGLSKVPIEVVHYGFDFATFSATAEEGQRVRAELGLERNFVVGCVARFVENKGHRFLLDAVPRLEREIPNLRLLFLGGGDPAAVKALVREKKLEHRVVFGGFRRDISACMRAMDLLVHPSLSEAFGQVTIECMSVATPVVATNIGGTSEVVQSNETGILIPPRNSDAIARAVLELYHQPELRLRLATAARQSVHARFPMERMIARQLEVYHRWKTRLRM